MRTLLVAFRDIREEGSKLVYWAGVIVFPALGLLLGLLVGSAMLGTGESDTAASPVDKMVVLAWVDPRSRQVSNLAAEMATHPVTAHRYGVPDAVAALAVGTVDAVISKEVLFVRESTSPVVVALIQNATTKRAAQDLDGSGLDQIDKLIALSALRVETVPAAVPEDAVSSRVYHLIPATLVASLVVFCAARIISVSEERVSPRVPYLYMRIVTPWETVGGKTLGLTALTLGQSSLLLVLLGIAIALLTDPTVELFLWPVLGLLVYVSLGARLCARISTQAGIYSRYLMLMAMIGLSFSLAFYTDSHLTGPIATLFSLLPPTAPFVASTRASLGTLPPWEYALSVIFALVFAAGMIWRAGKAYAVP